MIAYLTLRRLLRLAVLTFFRRLQVVGQEHVPDAGPVMFCGNHPNALLDPVLILCFCGRVVRFAAKDTLFDNWLLRPFLAILGVVPVKRRQDHVDAPLSNEMAFERLFEALASGDAIGLFPEGISHDASQLARFKTGVARIAFGIHDRHPGVRVPVVPCGLNYVTPDRFRSSVLVQFGPALTLDDRQLEAYRSNPHEAVRAFTAELETRLRSLTVNADDWETIRVLDGVRRLYQPPRISLEQRVELARRFNALYPRVKDEPAVRRLYDRVRAYLDRLAAAGLTDRDLRRTMRRRETVVRVARHMTLVVVWLPLAVLGAVIHVPVGLLLDVTGDRLNPDKTLRATLKFSLGVALLLTAYLVVPVAIGVAAGWGFGIAAFVLLPLSGYATLRVAERAVALRQLLRASIRVLRFGNEVETLRAEREALHVEIAEAVDRFGPRDREGPKPTVVFLHGIARTHRSMSLLHNAVRRAGYPTWSESYPSRRLSIVELAAWVAQRVREVVPDGEVVGVTHSMGGIVARHMVHLVAWRGIVMIAPPNRGSRVALALKDNPMFQWFFGPAGQELPDSAGWPMPPDPFAIIAGTRSASVFAPPGWLARASGVMPRDEPSDGIVTVSETRLTGMADFATVDASHTWIMNHPEVRAMVLEFLAHRRLGRPR